jgi:uncharacterized RDD family membrane protein YckC
MSITPMPDFQPLSDGIHLSALDAYAGKPGALEGVGFWPRAAARLVDTTMHYTIGRCSGYFFGFLTILVIRATHSRDLLLALRGVHVSIGILFFSILGAIAFHTICEGMHGSTPGKRLFSLVVVQEDGTPCRMRSALVRSLAYLVDSLFFGLVGYFNMQKSPQQQRHGDEWAHTVVCKRSTVAPENLRGIGTFVATLLLAVMADIALLMSGLLIQIAG